MASATLTTTPAGLSSSEVQDLHKRHGPNTLVPTEHRANWMAWAFRILGDPMALLLIVAGGAYLALGDRLDAAVVLIALIPITLVSVILEARAERALNALRKMTAPTVRALRDGRWQAVPAEDLVPGDVVEIKEGDLLPADGLFAEGTQLMVDESALTGESLPVAKQPGTAPGASLLAGTTVLSGRGVFQVTTTGSRTEYGAIGRLLEDSHEAKPPLQRAVMRLVRQLAVVSIVLCIVVVGIEVGRGLGWGAALIVGVSLGMAAIPEEFPMVYTLYLTLGAWQLAKERALVRRLPGVETLGSTTVICTDKTGTLTQGKVEVARVAAVDKDAANPDAIRPILEAAVLASEPNPFDPLEQAILRKAEAAGIDVRALHGGRLLADYPFDPGAKYMAHVWSWNGAAHTFAKGSAEGILSRAGQPRAAAEKVLAANEAMAKTGLRVLAVAAGPAAAEPGDREADERSLVPLGLIGFSDPVRPGVAEAIEECNRAGIRIVMITGDHPVTAHAVAEGLGLPHDDHIGTGAEIDAADDQTLATLVRDVDIFARVRPEQKHRIVETLRRQGEVVAMTGDGVNDAPALRQADIGIAMGQRGTEVARASATMILLDDNFATIVAAVRYGRRIFDNLRSAFGYLIGFHIPLLATALIVPLFVEEPLLLPVHLIWLELLVHPTVSLVFQADPPAPDLMARPPRKPGAGLLSGLTITSSLAGGIVLSIAVVLIYLLSQHQGMTDHQARSFALTAMLVGQSVLLLSQRSPEKPLWLGGSWSGNRIVPIVLAGTIASLLLVVYAPPMAPIAHVSPLPWTQLLAGIVIGAASILLLEPLKLLKRAPRAARS